ncbi:unnamed protein product [Aphanomyces euteiches]
MRIVLLSFVLATIALALNEDQHLGSHASSGLKTRFAADDTVEPTALRQLGETRYRRPSGSSGGGLGGKIKSGLSKLFGSGHSRSGYSGSRHLRPGRTNILPGPGHMPEGRIRRPVSGTTLNGGPIPSRYN